MIALIYDRAVDLVSSLQLFMIYITLRPIVHYTREAL